LTPNLSTPDVMRWIGDGSVLDRTRTAEEIANFERVWRDHGFGRFAVELRVTGVLTGFAGMAIPVDVPDVMPAVEIGWRFGREHWGRGIATEAARAALAFAFDESAWTGSSAFTSWATTRPAA
jgi:RimJ/RimL family protein N-acetyltransferase